MPPGKGARIQQNTNTELGQRSRAPALRSVEAIPGSGPTSPPPIPTRCARWRRPSNASEQAAGRDRRSGAATQAAAPQPATPRPNIVLAIADDWSFPHAGIYGDRTVRTPNFDRIAREGTRFTHAFVASPSCTPSRGALLSGQAVHRLGEGANLWSTLPKAHAVYPDLLEAGRLSSRLQRQGLGAGPGRSRRPDQESGRAGVQGLRAVHAAARRGPPVRVLVREHRSASSLRARKRRAERSRPGHCRRAAVPARHARGAERPARLLPRGPAVRSRPRHDHRVARARRRARQHDHHRDLGQRHALPAGQGQRLRRRRARAARDQVAGRGSGPARWSTRSSA